MNHTVGRGRGDGMEWSVLYVSEGTISRFFVGKYVGLGGRGGKDDFNYLVRKTGKMETI